MMNKILFSIVIFVTTVTSLSPVPNDYLMATSIDSKYGFPYNESLREPIIEFSYNDQRTVTILGIQYSCPDQLYVISYSSMDSKSTTQVCYSASMVMSALWESFTTGFNCKRINGMFSLSEQVTDFDIAYYSDNSYSAMTHLTVTSCKLELNSNIKLTQTFKNLANKLPTSYNSETCQYFVEFIKIFGTSFIPRGVFGGYVFMDSYFTETTSYTKDSSQISIEVGAQFLMFTTNTSVTWNNTEVGKYLDTTYNSTLELYGGYPEDYNPNNYSPWLASVPLNPIIVRGSLENLSMLLTPVNFDLEDLEGLMKKREDLIELNNILLFLVNKSNQQEDFEGKRLLVNLEINELNKKIIESQTKIIKLSEQQNALDEAINDYLGNGSIYLNCFMTA